jgi:hypothetical protein
MLGCGVIDPTGDDRSLSFLRFLVERRQKWRSHSVAFAI